MRKKICVLGSTGSIGQSALEVIKNNEDLFELVGLAAHSNIDLVEKQVKAFKVSHVAIFCHQKAKILQERLPDVHVYSGQLGLEEIATCVESDFVLSAIVGVAGLKPTLAAIEAKKTIGLANKETLVAAGELVKTKLAENQVSLIPVDSEHSAIFQCLQGEKIEDVKKLILTASGGPFRKYSHSQLKKVTLKEALCHPTWSMGPKITVDSSTLMNKGLELIEAYHLFDIPLENIDIIIHPQSLIHSFVEMVDGSLLAQLSQPSMTLPIQYAFTYPRRVNSFKSEDFNFSSVSWEFYPPSYENFPCLNLAREALRQGKSMPCFMNAVNEVLVDKFLKQKISWMQIASGIEQLMLNHRLQKINTIDDILFVDQEARRQAQEISFPKNMFV